MLRETLAEIEVLFEKYGSEGFLLALNKAASQGDEALLSALPVGFVGRHYGYQAAFGFQALLQEVGAHLAVEALPRMEPHAAH